jgi:2-polyprenyl-3-methyl-5-hydroxy-6-metoxy-1,4-benzoquinol methylase
MDIELTEKELKEEIHRLAPFHHKVELPYGLSTYVPEMSRRQIEYTRLSNLVSHAFPALIDACGGSLEGKRVLDVACNCGGFSVEAAKLGAKYVLGFDVVDHYIDQADFIKRALNLEQVDFKLMDLEKIDVSTVGQFDITFCFGILYHLENPISSMKRLSSVTRRAMLVDTDLESISFKRRPFSGFFVRRPFWLMNVPPPAASDPGSVTTSLWRTDRVIQFRPNEAAVVELLRFLGFQKVLRLRATLKGLEKRYYTGARGTFLAIRA